MRILDHRWAWRAVRSHAPALLACLVLAGIATGCSSVLGGIHLAPFYHRVHEHDGSVRTTYAGPLGYHDIEADGRVTSGFRPFYHSSYDADGNLEEVRSLWPIFRYTTRGGTEDRLMILPLFYYIRRPGPEGPEVDWALLPLLFGGREGDGQSYFAFFPIFGTLRGLLTTDRISFVLFPLFVATQSGEYRSKSILWPIFQKGEGGGRSTGRIFPFYGYDDKEGRWRRRTALWPFFHWQDNYLHTENPATLFLFFPFYGRESTAHSSKTILLWPFLSWSHDDLEPRTESNLPWPIHKQVASPEVSRFRLWPFYGTYQSKEIESTFWLWPLFHDRRVTTTDATWDSFYVVPFYTGWTRTDHASGDTESYTQVWPLARHHRTKEFTRTRGLSPIPFREFGPLEEDYGFLYTLYDREHENDAETTRTRLFLGLYESESGPDHASVTIPVVYDHHRIGEKSFSQFLLGLVSLESTDEETGLGLFWLPPLIRWRTGSPAEAGER